MTWNERLYRRGYEAARRRHRGRPWVLGELVAEHERLTQVDEFEVGFRDYTLEALEDADPVRAAKFLLRANLPTVSYERLRSMDATGQVVWRRHPLAPGVWEAWLAGDDESPVVSVDLPARDYAVREGGLE